MKRIALFMIFLLFLTACSSSDTTVTTLAKGKTTQTTLASTGDAFSDLMNLWSGSKMESRVEYDVTAMGRTSKQVQYMKGYQKIRMDSTYETTETRTFFVDNSFVSCTKMQTADWNCFKMPMDQELVGQMKNDMKEKVESDKANYKIVADGTQVIAGVTAKCFLITIIDPATSMRYCISPEGIMLYTKMDQIEMIATSYSKTVSDSDFVPPAEAKELSFPGQ